jgi:hypothetical protein
MQYERMTRYGKKEKEKNNERLWKSNLPSSTAVSLGEPM